MRLFWFILLAAGLIQPAWGQGPCTRNYVIGTVITSTDPDRDNVARVYMDILKEIQKRQGCQYTEKLVSLTRASDELRRHRIDIFAFAVPNDSWNEFSTNLPLLRIKRLLLIQKKHFIAGASVQDYIQNTKIKFGALSGTTFLISEKEISQLEKDNRVQYMPSPLSGIELFSKSKLDAMFFTPILLQSYAKKFQLREKSMLIVDKSEPLPLSMFFSKVRVTPAEIKSFEVTLTAMKKDGTLKEILRRYINEDDIINFYKF